MGKHTEQLIKLAKDGKIPSSSLLKAAVFKSELEKNARRMPRKPAPTPSIQMLPLLGATAAIGAGTFAANQLYKSIQEKRFERELPQHFDAMLEAHPQLMEEDPELVKRYFMSLVNVAPNIAQDPLAAGAFIIQSLRMSELGGPSVATYKDLAQTQKDVSQARKDRSATRSFSEDFTSPVSNVAHNIAQSTYNLKI